MNSPAACKTDEVKVYKRMLLCVFHLNSYTPIVLPCLVDTSCCKNAPANRVQCPYVDFFLAFKVINTEKVPSVPVYSSLLIIAELVGLHSSGIELMSRRTCL